MSAAPNASRENRLARETSPYLLQHKHNPVDWWPWGPEALAEARRSNRPILLSVGYAACHWCHVMAHESFENDAIAGVMNALKPVGDAWATQRPCSIARSRDDAICWLCSTVHV